MLATVLDIDNIGNKVIVHYNHTGSKNQVLDFIVDGDHPLECSKEDSEQLELIPAKYAKGTRACLPLNLDELIQMAETQFDPDSVKLGYAWTMPFDPVKGRQIKIAKKETEIRQLFNLTDDKKVSFWSHEWDNVDLNSLETTKKKLSFIRGVFSAKATIRPGPKGYISFCWEKLSEAEKAIDNYKNDSCDRIGEFLELFDYKLFKNYPNLEYEGCHIFFASRDQIGDYLKTVGFIQKTKMEVAMASYRLHLRVINSVVPVASDYLLYHAQNYSRPEDYDQQLLEYYDINVQDPKTGRTPLINSIKYSKYISLYPANWLIDNGANLTIRSKADGTFEDVFFKEVLVHFYSKLDAFAEFCLKVLDKISLTPAHYTHNYFKMLTCTFFNHRNFEKCSTNEILNKLDKTCLLKSILDQPCGPRIFDSYFCSVSEGESLALFLNKLVNCSSENLQEIYEMTLDKIEHFINKLSNNWRKSERCYNLFHSNEHLIVLFDLLNEKVAPNVNKIQRLQQEIDRMNISIFRWDFVSHCLVPDRSKPFKALLDLKCNAICMGRNLNYTEYRKCLTKTLEKSSEDLIEICDLVLDKILKMVEEYKKPNWNTENASIHQEDSDFYVALFDVICQRISPTSEKIQKIQNLLDQRGLKISRGEQIICEIFYPFYPFVAEPEIE